MRTIEVSEPVGEGDVKRVLKVRFGRLGEVDELRLTPVTGIVAAGSTQGDATALSAADVHVVETVAADTGVVLPAADPGWRVVVHNRGANPLDVYPAVGEDMDGVTNAPAVIAAGKSASFDAVAGGWHSLLGA